MSIIWYRWLVYVGAKIQNRGTLILETELLAIRQYLVERNIQTWKLHKYSKIADTCFQDSKDHTYPTNGK